MKLIIIFLLLVLTLVRPALAVVDPRLTPNNRVGIHVIEPDDLSAAANLVNGNGGDWGYVTLVMRQNDLNRETWQPVFDKMRRLRLIPIIRLATVPESSYWVKPLADQADQWVEFLNSLNWVTTNRYVILFNEPNHANEWGQAINPREYAEIVKAFSVKLKAASEDFFILPAGLDTAAPNSNNTMAATEFWRQMFLADNDIFKKFDGWNSHSYPNPDFSGSVYGSGLGSIRSYLAELNYLVQYGLPANLPVFITETGWRNQGRDLSQNYLTAYTSIWTQPNLIAVTPFILNYSQPPFTQFSWQIPGRLDFYPQYKAVTALSKVAGRPNQLQRNRLIDHNLPENLVAVSDYRFFTEWENLGQSIWNRQDFKLSIESDLPQNSMITTHLDTTEPGQTTRVELSLRTPEELGEYRLKLQLSYLDQPFGEAIEKIIKVIPPPSINLTAGLLFKLPGSNNQYRLLVYDAANQLLSENNLTFSNNKAKDVLLYNLVPGQAYRLVLLKPYYLPRQTWIVLEPDKNQAKFKIMLPVDINNDGKLSLSDFKDWLLKPFNYFGFGLQSGN